MQAFSTLVCVCVCVCVGGGGGGGGGGEDVIKWKHFPLN